MSERWVRRLRGVVTGMAAIGFLAAPVAPGAVAAGESPKVFEAMSGGWNGTGTITMADGNKERIRCRVVYDVAGSKLEQRMKCASDSYNFDAEAKVESNDRALAGKWSIVTYDVTGEVSGELDDRRLSVKVRGSGLVVQLVIVTSGEQQQISIYSEGTKVQQVLVRLAKTN